jgi:hypothetical protein
MARRMNSESFWHGLEQLVAEHRLVLDRPRGAPMNVHRAHLGGRPAVGEAHTELKSLSSP